MKTWISRSLWILAGLVVVVLLVLAFRPAPVRVETAEVRRGTLRVTVRDDGRTRVRERYTISAPIRGRLLRPLLDPGDAVRAGETTVAQFLPVSPGLLDARSREEAQARLRRAAAAMQEAEARRRQAAADLAFAQKELDRMKNLHAEGIQPREALDRAERAEQTAREGVRAAEQAVQVARYELEVARASLREAAPGDLEASLPPDVESAPAFVGTDEASGLLAIRSPIDGEVLRIQEESARNLEAGAPILEVGDTDRLEVVADFLSQDAVKIAPGMPGEIIGWGGIDDAGDARPLEARVRTVEPAGFTKVSALGVEEQRVNVILDPVGEPEAWASLGDGYHVEARVLLWEEPDALLAPSGALFRAGEDWAVYLVEGGRARLRRVEIGRRGEHEVEIRSGLEAGARVVLYPSALISDGTRVREN